MVNQKDVGKKRKGKQKRKHFAKELKKQTISLSFWAKKNAERFSQSKFCEVNNGAKPRSEATKGSPNEFGWLLNWCNIPMVRHRDLSRDPCGALAPCFHLVPHSVKVRLRSGWHIVVLFGLILLETPQEQNFPAARRGEKIKIEFSKNYLRQLLYWYCLLKT